MPMIIVPRTAMTSYVGGTKPIQEYLADDPVRYIPSQEILLDQTFSKLGHIESAIESLLDSRSSISVTQTSANLDYERNAPLSDKDFGNLCARIHVFGTMEELHEKIYRYYLYMKGLLREFLAAAVTNWVIDERRVSISRALFYSTASSQAYEREVKQGTPCEPPASFR